MSRPEQTAGVRRDVLRAAREEFLAHGFHGATLDRIASAAGYTKGAVYSRWAGKADLFLALLEERIEARRADNERAVPPGTGPGAVAEMAQGWAEEQERERDWTLLVLEFRVHAARDAELNARYARLHARTLDGIAAVLEPVTGGDASQRRRLGRLLFAIGTGVSLEEAVEPDAFPPDLNRAVVAALVEGLS